MPQLTGLKLLDKFKRLGIEIPIKIITGQDNIRVRERCNSAGVVAVFRSQYNYITVVRYR